MTQQATYEGWFRRLTDEKCIEIFLKANGVRVRATGEEEAMYELVDWFESQTGVRVEHPNWRRVRVGPRPIEGQLTLVMGDATDG